MSNRKKTRVDKADKYLTKVLGDLKSRDQTGKLSPDLQTIHSKLVGMLLNDEISGALIESIAEMFRIAAPRNILGNAELDLFFNGILKLLTTTPMKLETLVKYRIPALLKNKSIIEEYVKMVGKTLLNRQYLEEIIVILIEESGIANVIIKSLLERLEAAKNIIKRKSNEILMNEVSDEQYVRIYCDILEGNYDKPIRIVKGPERLKYVKLAIEMNNEEICEAYKNDRDIRVRKIVAEKCKSERIFEIIVHDESEKVRKRALERLRWNDIKKYKIYDRILDKSYDVRQEIYRIFREGVALLDRSWLFDKESKIFRRGEEKKQIKKFQFEFLDENLSFEKLKKEEDIEVMIKYVNKLCEGCASIAGEEYISILIESNLSIKFLDELKANPYACFLFQNLEIDFVDDEHAEFCLEYIYSKELEEYQIQKYLNMNCFAVLKFIKDISNYNMFLIEKACISDDRKSVEKILERLILWLNTKYLVLINKGKVIVFDNAEDVVIFENSEGVVEIEKTIQFDQCKNNGTNNKINYSRYQEDNEIDFMTRKIIEFLFETQNLLLVNAHTRWGSLNIVSFMAQFITSRKASYEFFYFLSQKKFCDQTVCEAIRKCQLDKNDLVNLLLNFDDPKILHFFAKQLLGCRISYERQLQIKSKSTRTGFIIYFLSSGAVNCKSLDFFLNSLSVVIQACDQLNSNTKQLLKRIYTKYISIIPQSDYDIIYSTAQLLKGYAFQFISKNCVIDTSVNTNQKETINLNNCKFENKSENKSENKESSNCKSGNVNKEFFKIPKKTKVPFCNKVLYFICDFIILFRKGEPRNITFDFEVHGFYKLDEETKEKIKRKQIEYV